MTTVCICGGGSLGHVIAGFLGAEDNIKVNVLTTRPNQWNSTIDVYAPKDEIIKGRLNIISNLPEDVIPQSDIVLLCLPGFAIKKELELIKPYITPKIRLGSVFSSTGFFFEAQKLFSSDITLWGFQRVPFIARVKEYGKSAFLLGYKDSYNIAIENCDTKEDFRQEIELMFKRPTHLLNNYYEASFTNSNPILHPARLYSMFKDWQPGMVYEHHTMFYEEWSVEASELLIKMDNELFSMLEKLPVASDFLMPILEYYESHDAQSLTDKLRSIKGFKGIKSPMIEVENGFVPDFSTRYFKEDFPYGLHYIYTKAKELGIDTPVIDRVYAWGMSRISK